MKMEVKQMAGQIKMTPEQMRQRAGEFRAAVNIGLGTGIG